MELLKSAVHIIDTLSTSMVLGEGIGLVHLGISMGGLNPSGFGWGRGWVRVRVAIFHPANDPYPD